MYETHTLFVDSPHLSWFCSFRDLIFRMKNRHHDFGIFHWFLSFPIQKRPFKWQKNPKYSNRHAAFVTKICMYTREKPQMQKYSNPFLFNLCLCTPLSMYQCAFCELSHVRDFAEEMMIKYPLWNIFVQKDNPYIDNNK